jgi:pimeloyl-ACP methyl ester carboxylesterase
MAERKTLQIAGYRNEPVPNTFFRQKEDAQHVAIVLPGVRYTCHMPLLYYPSRLLRIQGADVLWVEYAYNERRDFQMLSDAERERWFITDVTAACNAALAQRPYRQITLVGKSLGTLAMGYLLSEAVLSAASQALWLTPLFRNDRLRAQIRQSKSRSLFVIGSADSHYDPAYLAEVQAATGGQTVVIDGGDHSLEIEGNVWRSLQALEQVLRAIEASLTPNAPA